MPYCSQCQLIHGEEHRFCQRCGQLLKGNQSAAARPCARCGVLTFPGQKFCTECGLPLRVARVAHEEAEPQRPPLFYPHRPEPANRRRPRRLGRALSVIAAVLVLVGVYYLWNHLSARTPGPRVPTIASPQDDLRLDVERLAEKIRAAHLNKDINKWLSCYASAYPNLGSLESQMLELWKNYDVKEVSYRITNIQPQGERQASADIVWNIQVYDHRTHDYTLLRPAYKIYLEKGGSGWKIRDSKEEGGGPS